MRYDPTIATGRDHYRALFEVGLDDEAEWLRRGARHKVDSLQRLLAAVGARPDIVVELGAGTGAVIEECRRRELGRDYLAVDYSAAALDYLRSRAPDIGTLAADLADPDLDLPRADLMILSHVLEHVEDPPGLLRAVRALDFEYLAIEVPLEDLLVGRLLAGVRDRAHNSAGHVQFFRGPDVDRLVSDAGFEIVARYRYAPVLELDTIAFAARKNGVSSLRRMVQSLTGHAFPRFLGPLWSRLYYGHYAVLCRPAARLDD